ncbi:hypothetical protein [Paractinoplanes durhamensis]|uniref:hypothetical protein n=1 Tax=Paractinoplanes durhamensis TaxID=113563 RepID=UPI0036427588
MATSVAPAAFSEQPGEASGIIAAATVVGWSDGWAGWDRRLTPPATPSTSTTPAAAPTAAICLRRRRTRPPRAMAACAISPGSKPGSSLTA